MATSASVIVPSHNRPDAILSTVTHLLRSALSAGAEVVVVDDGSMPPIVLPQNDRLRLVRTPGVERSRSRNQGACSAVGELLIFVDDDITVSTDFIEQHARAALEFRNAIGVGKISLPSESTASPFGRFRRTIEEPSQSRARGLVAEKNFCTAANMSMSKREFLNLGGFDPAISSGEDQDLALRFSERGGQIAFLPEAEVIHRDSIAGIFAYARRHEWGAAAMAPFLRRYPDRPENLVRARLAVSPAGAAFPVETVRILVRLLLSRRLPLALFRGLTRGLEQAGSSDAILFPLYRTLLGLHLFRGFREGLARVRVPPSLPTPIVIARSAN